LETAASVYTAGKIAATAANQTTQARKIAEMAEIAASSQQPTSPPQRQHQAEIGSWKIGSQYKEYSISI
jgi:hypothetical protein